MSLPKGFINALPVIGSAVGSIVPGVGTAIGGAAGGVMKSVLSGNQNNGGNQNNDNLGNFNLDSGSVVPMTMGLMQNLKAAAMKKNAQGAFPAGEDPELRALATDFARRKRAYQTGTALNSQQANIQSLNKQAINSAFNSGAGMAGINRLAQITNQAMTGLQNQSLQGEMYYGNQQANMINTLAQTSLEKALLKYNQGMADSAQMKTNANRNLNLGLMRALPIGQVNPDVASASFDATNNNSATQYNTQQKINQTGYNG